MWMGCGVRCVWVFLLRAGCPLLVAAFFKHALDPVAKNARFIKSRLDKSPVQVLNFAHAGFDQQCLKPQLSDRRCN